MNISRSPIFDISDEFIQKCAELSPILASNLGITGFDGQLDDYSYAHAERTAEYLKDVLARLVKLDPQDEIDRIAKFVLSERIESKLDLHASLERYATFSVISSPAGSIREAFSLMPTESPTEIANVAARLAAVDSSLNSWKSLVEYTYDLGARTSKRQVLGVADQLLTHSQGSYSEFAQSIDPEGRYPELHLSARAAEVACKEMGDWLREVHAPRSSQADGVGEERYLKWARYYSGATIDLRETYDWGRADLARINARMWEIARTLVPEAQSLAEVAEHLENSPMHRIEGEAALVAELLKFTEASISKLDGIYFEIDPRIKFCDARIAPEGTAAAPYYISPSEDLSRPGTTWYPTLGEESFNFWHIASTWYHEAIPGHHLQIGVAILEKDRLSRFQRTEAWTSGYGEGWALYAERLMNELGAFEDPAFEMGYLAGQALRAARIVVDIGMHLGYLDENGEVWNAESAFNLLVEKALQTPAMARSEVERYLGWPGQAISYKLGEKYWLEIREAAKVRLGESFSLKNFHSYALKIGPMGLDSLRDEMALWEGNP
ncbi:MAG: DUF885 domain-containing protein [Actinomycetes bacterium]|jgi:uncharacterized protein (DUF885 family)